MAEGDIVTSVHDSLLEKAERLPGQDIVVPRNIPTVVVNGYDESTEPKETPQECNQEADIDAKESTENAEDSWLQVLGNDQLLKKILKKGVNSTRPETTNICTVNLTYKLDDGSDFVFEKHNNLQVQLGDAEVILGVEMSIPLMNPEEISVVKIKPRFAYGNEGLLPNVPPSTPIVAEIELLTFTKEKDLEEMTIAERKEIGNRKRERGNWWYARKESSLAVQCYRKAINYLDEVEGGIEFPSEKKPESEDYMKQMKDLMEDRLIVYNNLAAAQLKLGAYEPALQSVEVVLKCQPDNVKAIFRKGKILGDKGDTENALKVLRHGLKLQPKNADIQKEINKLGTRQKKETKTEKKLYARMFPETKEKKTSNTKKESSKSLFSLGLVAGGVAVALLGVMAYRYRAFNSNTVFNSI